MGGGGGGGSNASGTVVGCPPQQGAGGGGGGSGERAGGQETGSGFGTGFGVRAQPVGVYEVRDGQVAWRPIVDITRLAHGGQVLAGIVTVCVTLVALRRSRVPS